MKALRFIAVAMTALFAQSSFAQGWQIEGGLSNRKTQQPKYDQEYYEEVDPSYSRNNFESPVTVFFGYVNKTWNTEFDDGRLVKENFWGETDKRLHGFQIGALYEPTANLGVLQFGVSMGLAFETYFSESPAVRDAGYDSFTEYGVYVPLHAKFTIPLGYKASFSLYGGLGMNLAVVGTFNDDHCYRDRYGNYYTDTYVDYQDYGNGRYPRHFNLQTEYGGSVNINNWGVRFTYSQGLTNHKLYKGCETFQNKINVAVSYTF